LTATFNFQEYSIPADVAKLCAIDSQNFGAGSGHLGYIDGVVGIEKEHHILEVGSALGRIAIPLTKRLGPNACFKGMDIVRPAIEWCNENISNSHPNFHFFHFDVKDDHHNRTGKLETTSIRLPAANGSIDRIIA
jgi:hypothetical protein